MNQNTLKKSSAAAFVCVALAGAYAHFGPHWLAHAQEPSQEPVVPAPSVVQPITSAAAVVAPTDFSGIVERYGPAVVNISVTGKTQPVLSGFSMPERGDPRDPFQDFFRRFGPQFPQVPQEGQLTHGQGSGFIVSPDGLLLTNAHVVDGAQEVIVKLTDRREFKAKVLGTDKQTDVAVLRIDAKDLPAVKLGNPGTTRVGEPVLAIGSPFGFENTVTAGIVSAKSRALPNDTYVPFIQTDVAVNPGNSGGPLFNLKGEVIGINSQIYSRNGGYQGLSFAIPIDVASRIQAQLVSNGKVTRGRLGVTIQDLNQSLADSFGLKKTQGALVSAVEPDSPADRAGIKAGDVIVKLDEQAINQSADLPAQVAAVKPGTVARLGIIREGASKVLPVTVGEFASKSVAKNDEPANEHSRLGVSVRQLAKEEQSQIGVPNGVLVEEVQGPAARAGIQQGDVIVSVNGVAVSSVDQLQKLVRKAGKNVALLVQRESSRIFVPVELG